MTQSERFRAVPVSFSPSGFPRLRSLPAIDIRIGGESIPPLSDPFNDAPKVFVAKDPPVVTLPPSNRAAKKLSARAARVSPTFVTRLVSLGGLALAAAAVLTGARGTYYAFVDSSVLPTTIGPDSDSVVQLNIQLTDLTVEHTRIQAENERLTATFASVSAAIRRLETLRASESEAAPATANAEHDIRLVLELEKLEAEKRSLAAALQANGEALAKREETMAQLRRRPLARALDATMNLAFVPYSQLPGITVGAELVTCSAVVVGCRTVGHVAEILPGEVTTTDPAADTARGQYIVLELSDRDAGREKTLRVRTTNPRGY